MTEYGIQMSWFTFNLLPLEVLLTLLPGQQAYRPACDYPASCILKMFYFVTNTDHGRGSEYVPGSATGNPQQAKSYTLCRVSFINPSRLIQGVFII
jgi:hypothetical protein